MIAHRVRDLAVDALARLDVEPVRPSGREILLIRPDHLGDVLFLTPALRRLRRAVPGAHITLAVGPWARDVVAKNPDVDEVIEFSFPGFTRGDPGPVAPYRALAAFTRIVRERRPAAAVVLRDDHWWAALAIQHAGVPARVGVDHRAVRRMLTRPVPVKGHWVVRNAVLLDAVAALLGGTPPLEPVTPATDPLRWEVAPEARTAARALLHADGVGESYVVLAPGAGVSVKLWPAERWGAVVSTLSRERALAVVLVGTAGERPLVERVRAASAARVVDLAGDTDLPTLSAVLAGASLVLGVDSGPLHLAAAVGAQTLRLYGPSAIADYGPWGDPSCHRSVTAGMCCSRCGDLSPARPEGAGCMLAIGVAEVLAAAREMLDRG